MSSGIPKYLKMELNNNLAVIMAVGRPLMESSRQDFENRSTITSMHVLPSESGRSVMKSTPRCDHGRLGMGNGRSFPAGKWQGLLEMAQSVQPLDEPSHIPGHVGPPVAVFQQQEGAVGGMRGVR